MIIWVFLHLSSSHWPTSCCDSQPSHSFKFLRSCLFSSIIIVCTSTSHWEVINLYWSLFLHSQLRENILSCSPWDAKADLSIEKVEKMSLQRFGCLFFKPINTHKLLRTTLIPQTSWDCSTFTGPTERALPATVRSNCSSPIHHPPTSTGQKNFGTHVLCK